MGMSTELEAVSLLIIIVLGMFHYDKLSRNNRRYRLFNWCLFSSGVAITINILSCYFIDGTIVAPMWANILVNSANFVAVTMNLAMMAGYAFFLLFEFNPNRDCFKKAVTIVMMLTVVLLTLVIVNLWTGCYFYFEGTIYKRGPLNRIGFLFLLTELILFCICYFKFKDTVSTGIHQLIQAMPPLLIILVVAQMLFPDILLTGTLTALVSICFFACFQNNRIGRDALTEIPNRSCFFRDLNDRKEQKYHLILLNLNNYASVNRKFGMSKGGSFLFLMARYLDDLDSKYQVYRYGNTRFMLLGTYVSEEASLAMAERIHRKFIEGWELDGKHCYINTQLVHMVLDEGEIDANRLIDQLDYVLLYAKNNNKSLRNSLVFYDDRLKKLFERKDYVIQEIRYALKNESFELYFQPVYSQTEQKFTSAEALLRLFARDGKSISPAEFIPLAEEKGLIDEITWMVLKKVCIFLSEHPKLPLESVSMNMSVQQILERSLCDRIHTYLSQYGVDADKLCIEITESVVAENPTLVSYVMKSLGAEGIRFYLDDFGVGYSNLAGVMNLPFDTVKIDKSIMREIDSSKKKYQTADLLVQMLHNAGFTVVAEGLERESQVDKAGQMHIEKIQGFYYAKPMDERNLIEFLRVNE